MVLKRLPLESLGREAASKLLITVPPQSLERLENNLKKLLLITVLFAFFAVVGTAHAQQLDLGVGFGTLSSPALTTSGGVIYPSERGGLYPSFSADFLVYHRIGFEGEIAWRGSQNLYGGIGGNPYRPVFYSFNAIWAPRLSKNFTAEVLGGIGGEDIRFYGTANFNPFSGYTNYVSSNHFMGDVGGGLRAYFWHNAFIRPEVRLYLIHNNIEFSSGYAARYGATLGYSFGGK